MKHALLLVVLVTLAACEQRVSTPMPGPAANTGNDPKKIDPTNMTKKPDNTSTGQTSTTTPPDTANNAGKSSDDGNKVAKTNDPANPEKIEAITLSEADWKKKLTDEEYYVLRKKGTERAFTGKYDKFYKKGRYLCAGCGLELFTSDTKFDSQCGWPAFYAAKAGDRIKRTVELDGRVEVTCARCDGHLGHVFENEGFSKELVPTGQRYCINSVSIKFVPAEGPLRENIADEKK